MSIDTIAMGPAQCPCSGGLLSSVAGSTSMLFELGTVLEDDLKIAISSSPLPALDDVLASV